MVLGVDVFFGGLDAEIAWNFRLRDGSRLGEYQ